MMMSNKATKRKNKINNLFDDDDNNRIINNKNNIPILSKINYDFVKYDNDYNNSKFIPFDVEKINKNNIYKSNNNNNNFKFIPVESKKVNQPPSLLSSPYLLDNDYNNSKFIPVESRKVNQLSSLLSSPYLLDNDYNNSKFIPVESRKVNNIIPYQDYANHQYNNIYEKKYLYVMNSSKITGFKNIINKIVKNQHLIDDILLNYAPGVEIIFERYNDENPNIKRTVYEKSVEKTSLNSFELYGPLLVGYLYNISNIINKKIMLYNINDELRKITPRILIGELLNSLSTVNIYIKSNLEYFIIDDDLVF